MAAISVVAGSLWLIVHSIQVGAASQVEFRHLQAALETQSKIIEIRQREAEYAKSQWQKAEARLTAVQAKHQGMLKQLQDIPKQGEACPENCTLNWKME